MFSTSLFPALINAVFRPFRLFLASFNIYLTYNNKKSKSYGSLYISIGIRDSVYNSKWSLTTYASDHLCMHYLYVLKKGGFSMRDLKTYLSAAPVLSTLWFGALAGLLIEINRFFPDALTFPFFSF